MNYENYVLRQSPFDTHQGVKGAEFDRVLVVLDDEEAKYNLFSYGKFFGITPRSDNDKANIADGKDSVLDRTTRLFYVCCSRAAEHLAVVFYVPAEEVWAAVEGAKEFFGEQDIFTVADLS